MSQAKIVTVLRLLYPLWVIVGLFSMMYVPSVFWVSGNETQTIVNIQDNQFLFRVGILGNVVVNLFYIIIPFLLYQLFKGFNKDWAKLMLILALIGATMAFLNEIFQLRTLDILNKPNEAYLMLKTYNHGLTIASFFWGIWLFPLGWLTIKSGFFPKLIGLLLYLAGIGYIVQAVIAILAPEFKSLNTPLEIMLFGEVAFILWFAIKGIKRPVA